MTAMSMPLLIDILARATWALPVLAQIPSAPEALRTYIVWNPIIFSTSPHLRSDFRAPIGTLSILIHLAAGPYRLHLPQYPDNSTASPSTMNGTASHHTHPHGSHGYISNEGRRRNALVPPASPPETAAAWSNADVNGSAATNPLFTPVDPYPSPDGSVRNDGAVQA